MCKIPVHPLVVWWPRWDLDFFHWSVRCTPECSEDLLEMLGATSLLQMLSYIPIHDMFERKKGLNHPLYAYDDTNAFYYLLASILIAMKPFLPLTTAHCRNSQLYFLFGSFYYILLGNILFPKTLWLHGLLLMPIIDQHLFWRVFFGSWLKSESDIHRTTISNSQVEN